jgi:hypothetical protein
MSPWLAKVLADAGDRWKVVFFHAPVFTHSEYEPSKKLLEAIVPVLDRNGVHLALSGHSHLYERTHPIRDGEVVANGEGTVYVTTGAGGARLYAARPDPPAYMAKQWDGGHCFTIIDAGAERIAIRQIDSDGNELDAFEIPRGPVSDEPAGHSKGTPRGRPLRISDCGFGIEHVSPPESAIRNPQLAM